MNEASSDDAADSNESHGGAEVPPKGMSPYATGGGGVTFERKVAVQYLAHLLVGDAAGELGDGRCVHSVAFQQAPDYPVDDLVVNAAGPDELQPSLVLALAVRRSPNLVVSAEPTRKLIREFVRAVVDAPADEREHRIGLVVAGPQQHAKQLASLVSHAAAQMDASGFFELVRTPGKFDAAIRGRLDQVEQLVTCALHDFGVAPVDTGVVQEHVWQMLVRLTISMPRLEPPDDTDWSAVTNSLIPVARDAGPAGASRLRDRLATLASEYSPRSACVDLTLLRRDTYLLLDPTTRRHKQGWQALDLLHHSALAAVRDHIVAADGARRVRLDRRAAEKELIARAANAASVVVSGESGIGKSALALRGFAAAGEKDPDGVQALCVNLRHIPELPLEFENKLGCPLSTLLRELGAPCRSLIVDAADIIAEGKLDAFRYLVEAARSSDVKVVAVTSVDTKQFVRDTLTECFASDVVDYAVAPLTDTEIDGIVDTFTELRSLNGTPRSRDLLRRLIVIDLLVRGRVRGVPLSDADAMKEVWSGLVRRHEVSDRGTPDARDVALLRLAELDLTGGERLDVISKIDPGALDGLRRDGLLRRSTDELFTIGPEFAHDEVRRYALARLLLASDTPASRILQNGAPRWSLSAARLACQAWLGRPDAATTPARGRLRKLQASFDGLVDAGHGTRWGDVPGEALLALPNPEAVIQDAWPELRADGSAGLQRLARLVKQRLRDENGIVNLLAVEPIIKLLLEDEIPWRSGDYAQELLRDWLRAHVFAGTPAGHPLRILLRMRLVEACAAADRRLAEERRATAAARAARASEELEQERRFGENHSELSSEIGHGGRRSRQRPEVPDEIRDKIVVEFLALLGPDLDDDATGILRRVAQDAPSWLAPAVEEPFTDRALANYGHGLLAQLTEGYYLDAEADGHGVHDDGIRSHRARSAGLLSPRAAWYRGPFMLLFRSEFRNGVAVLNRLLNHAARIRVRTLIPQGRIGGPLEDAPAGPYETELEITGARQLCVGDEHVWLWYRGTGVGPYPCFSALQALERMCDQWIESGTPVRTLVSILLDGCENLAMVGLVVGLLVRHIESADDLLDPYLADPLIWHYEFTRVTHETNGFAASSDGLKAPERRKWTLREVAGMMVLRADDERATALRAIGEALVANARRAIRPTRKNDPSRTGIDAPGFVQQELAQVRSWASNLNRDRYQAHQAPDGTYIQATPPEDVVRTLQPRNEELLRIQEAIRLVVRYSTDHKNERDEAIGPKELTTDVAAARNLLENPPSLSAHDPWDASGLVAAAVLNAHLLGGAGICDDALSFSVDIVLRIGDGAVWPRQYEFEETYFERGADRSAARALPLLLLPAAAPLRATVDEADGGTTFDRAARAGLNLAHAVANEVRLHLARGLDPVWEAPCAEEGRCHHEVALWLTTETMRDCVIGGWNAEDGRRSVIVLQEPVGEALANADDDSILAFRLDAAIRSLALAATVDTCVSTQARALLLTLLAAQRRALLSHERDDTDPRGTHALVSAHALLTLAALGDDGAIYEHIDAYADNSALLGTLLRALSAVAEETPGRARTARRIWPHIVRHVLELNAAGHAPFQDPYYGEEALAALIPNTAAEHEYLYRELRDNPLPWWDPLSLRAEVESWLVPAAGRPECVDQLISFLGVLAPDDQMRTGLPWISTLVLADPARLANRTYLLTTWLIEKRSAAFDAGLEATWQAVVDVLVVEGVTRLAPYSD